MTFKMIVISSVRASWVVALLVVLSNLLPACCASHFFAVVIDAGSTGSRAFVYNIAFDEESHERTNVTSNACGKVRPGLSSFAKDPTAAVEYLLPLLKTAAAMIPAEQLPTTKLYIKGTAGMRILSDQEQLLLWRAVEEGLTAHPDTLLLIEADNFGTISGHLEAFYAVLAANYIYGSITAELTPTGDYPMIGALDMGGSSNQLVIYNGTSTSSDNEMVQSDHFWSHSWLHFGVERIRERVLHYMYHLHTASQYAATTTAATDETDVAVAAAAAGVLADLENDPSIGRNTVNINNADNYEELVAEVAGRIPNPCSLVGSEDLYDGDGKWIFHGTGEAEKCLQLVQQVLWPPLQQQQQRCGSTSEAAVSYQEVNIDGTVSQSQESQESLQQQQQQLREGDCYPWPVNSIAHPPVEGQQFYAMSVYFYALDFIRSLGPNPLPHWPNPTLRELKAAVFEFCAMEWHSLQKAYSSSQRSHNNQQQQQQQQQQHQYTSDFQIPHRCLEGIFIVTLLEKGFGFHPDSRSITLALEIQGNEVEWTLGFVLSEVRFQPLISNAATLVDSNNNNSSSDKSNLVSERGRLSARVQLRGMFRSFHSVARSIAALFSSAWNSFSGLFNFKY